MRAPAPRAITRGVPPTERNARTGLFTPPTRIASAWRKISSERWCDLGALTGAPPSRLQPAGRVFGVVGANNVGAGALDTREQFQYHALFVNPAIRCRGFHHRVFAADVVGGHRHRIRVADPADHVE